MLFLFLFCFQVVLIGLSPVHSVAGELVVLLVHIIMDNVPEERNPQSGVDCIILSHACVYQEVGVCHTADHCVPLSTLLSGSGRVRGGGLEGRGRGHGREGDMEGKGEGHVS